MHFDLRLPLGLMFTLFGGMLSIYGLLASADTFKKSLGINIDLGWGLVMLVFGLLMLTLALKARNRKDPKA